jgi:hypothetical protein
MRGIFMIASKLRSAGFALAALLCGAASAQTTRTSPDAMIAHDARPIPGVGVAIGDTVATVKQALKTDVEPQPYNAGEHKKGMLLRQLTKGMRFFFDEAGKVDTIRLEEPFAAAMGGIQLGDTLQKLTEVRGKPVRHWEYGEDEAYLYPLDDDTYVRYDVNKSGEIVTMFLFK